LRLPDFRWRRDGAMREWPDDVADCARNEIVAAKKKEPANRIVACCEQCPDTGQQGWRGDLCAAEGRTELWIGLSPERDQSL
jgi:hypothetical protein